MKRRLQRPLYPLLLLIVILCCALPASYAANMRSATFSEVTRSTVEVAMDLTDDKKHGTVFWSAVEFQAAASPPSFGEMLSGVVGFAQGSWAYQHQYANGGILNRTIVGLPAETKMTIYVTNMNEEDNTVLEVGVFTTSPVDERNQIRYSGFHDTTIVSTSTIANHGSSEYLRLLADEASAILLHVDMPLETGLKPYKAELALHLRKSQMDRAQTLYLYRLKRPWGEYAATAACSSDLSPGVAESGCATYLEWNLLKKSKKDFFYPNNPVTVTLPKTRQSGWIKFDITKHVTDLLEGADPKKKDNFGWALLKANTTSASLRFDSQESLIPPELILHFSESMGQDASSMGFGPTCAGEAAHLACPEDSEIRILYAGWGRQNDWSCRDPALPAQRFDNQNCHSGSSVYQVARRCNHRQTCDLPVDSLDFLDPCVGTEKYLEGRYSCVPTLTFCEDQQVGNGTNQGYCINTFEGPVWECYEGFQGPTCETEASVDAALAPTMYLDFADADDSGTFLQDQVGTAVPVAMQGLSNQLGETSGMAFTSPQALVIPLANSGKTFEALMTDSSFSVSMWVKPYLFANTVNCLVSSGPPFAEYEAEAAEMPIFEIIQRQGAQNTLEARVMFTGVEEPQVVSIDPGMSANHWHFVALVVSKDVANVDNKRVVSITLHLDNTTKTLSVVGTGERAVASPTQKITIGSASKRMQYQFEGVVDDVAFWDVALKTEDLIFVMDNNFPVSGNGPAGLSSTAEMIELKDVSSLLAYYPFDHGTFSDYTLSGTTYDGVSTGDVVIGKGYVGRGAVITETEHGGVSRLAFRLRAEPLEEFSLSFWVKPNAFNVTTNALLGTGIHAGANVGSGFGIYQEKYQDGSKRLGALKVRFERENGRQTIELPGIAEHQWHFIAISFTETEQILTVNAEMSIAHENTLGPLRQLKWPELYAGADVSSTAKYQTNMAIDEINFLRNASTSTGISALRSVYLNLPENVRESSDLYESVGLIAHLDPTIKNEVDMATYTKHGCSDGSREALTDEDAFPDIAACDGGWGVEGVTTQASRYYQCGGYAGNDVEAEANADSDSDFDANSCSVADLCSVGWHVCESYMDVQKSAPDQFLCGDQTWPARTFYATRQSGEGGRTYSYTGLNDIFGCGSLGEQVQAPLETPVVTPIFNRLSYDQCTKLNDHWQCPNSVAEASTVTHDANSAGGVLCCRDRGNSDNSVANSVTNVTYKAPFGLVMGGRISDVDPEFQGQLYATQISNYLNLTKVTQEVTPFRLYDYYWANTLDQNDVVVDDTTLTHGVLYYFYVEVIGATDANASIELMQNIVRDLPNDDPELNLNFHQVLELEVCSDGTIRTPSNCATVVVREIVDDPGYEDDLLHIIVNKAQRFVFNQTLFVQIMIAILSVVFIGFLLWLLKKGLKRTSDAFIAITADGELSDFSDELEDIEMSRVVVNKHDLPKTPPPRRENNDTVTIHGKTISTIKKPVSSASKKTKAKKSERQRQKELIRLQLEDSEDSDIEFDNL